MSRDQACVNLKRIEEIKSALYQACTMPPLSLTTFWSWASLSPFYKRILSFKWVNIISETKWLGNGRTRIWTPAWIHALFSAPHCCSPETMLAMLTKNDILSLDDILLLPTTNEGSTTRLQDSASNSWASLLRSLHRDESTTSNIR